MFGRLFVIALVALGSLVVGASATSAQVAPTCAGLSATQWLNAPGTLFFTAGDDVFVGSAGSDQFLTSGFGVIGGTDLVCANGGNDLVEEIWGVGSIAYGGSGSDKIIARAGATAKGGAGNDCNAGYNPGCTVNGGIYLYGAGSTGHGEAGNDFVKADGDGATAHGDDGSDHVRATNGGEAYGDAHADSVYASEPTSYGYGGTGDDDIVAGDDSPKVGGGPGNDDILVDSFGTGLVIQCGANSDTVNLQGYVGASISADCEVVIP